MAEKFGQVIQNITPLLAAMSASYGQGMGPFGYMPQGLAATMQMQKDKRAEAEEKARRAAGDSLFSGLMGSGGMGGGGMPAAPRGPNAGIADDAMRAIGKTPMGPYRDAIASIESAGSGDYAAVGPTHPELGRALGRYQVMEANIGPWSREVLGREVTPEEFIANPRIQDAIFDGKFGGYVNQYGPEGAAQAWFAGPGGVGQMGRKDSLGTTVGDYTQKFTTAMGGGSASGGMAGGGATNVQGSPDMARLIAAYANPNLSPEQRQAIGLMIEMEQQKGQGSEATALQKNYEYALSQGMTPEQARAWVSNAPVTNVNMGKAETAFDVEAAKLQATMFSELSKDGVNAAADLGQIDVIDGLLKSGAGGTADAWKLWAQRNLGVQIAGGAVEALDAAINKLVPTQRPPGSGTMSDRDVQLFKDSLPQLINTPEGNAIIVETMRGMAQYKRAQGEIAAQAITGQITPQQAIEMLQAIPDPLANVKAMVGQGGLPAAAPSATTSRPRATNPQTGEVVEWDGTAWVPVQ